MYYRNQKRKWKCYNSEVLQLSFSEDLKTEGCIYFSSLIKWHAELKKMLVWSSIVEDCGPCLWYSQKMKRRDCEQGYSLMTALNWPKYIEVPIMHLRDQALHEPKLFVIKFDSLCSKLNILLNIFNVWYFMRRFLLFSQLVEIAKDN